MSKEETEDNFEDAFGEGTAPAEPVVTQTPEPPAEPKGPQRDEHGRFVKAEGAQAPASEPAQPAQATTGETPAPVQEPESPSGEGKFVPTSVLVATRKELQSKIDALERRMAERPPSQPQPAANPPPDPNEDPDGYRQWQAINHVQENAALTGKLNMSEYYARKQFGNEKVDAAMSALKAAQDPALHQRILRAEDPYESLVKWHDEALVQAEISQAGGIKAYVAQLVEAAKNPAPAQPGNGQALPQTPVQQPKPVTATPPPPLSKGGAGNSASDVVTEDDFFAATFKR